MHSHWDFTYADPAGGLLVLILVLMEDALALITLEDEVDGQD